MDVNERRKIEAKVEQMEKSIVYFKGRERARSRRKYLQLLCAKKGHCLLYEPIYIDRI